MPLARGHKPPPDSARRGSGADRPESAAPRLMRSQSSALASCAPAGRPPPSARATRPAHTANRRCPAPSVRQQLRPQRIGQRPEQRRLFTQAGQAQPAPHPPACQQQMQQDHQVEMQRRGQKQRQPLRRIGDFVERIGGEGLAAQDGLLPEGKRPGLVQVQRGRPVRDGRIGKRRVGDEGQRVRVASRAAAETAARRRPRSG